MLRTYQDYKAAQKEVAELTEQTLIKYVEDKPLTEQDFKNLEKAEPIARGMIAYDSRVYTSHLILAQILIAQGKRDEALERFRQCLLLAPPPEKRDEAAKFIVAETLNDTANIYYSKNQFKEAESYVREASLIYPNNIKYLANLTQILLAANRVEEARETLEKIRRIKPDSEALAALEPLVKDPNAGAEPKKPSQK